jgi:hypothetical protein
MNRAGGNEHVDTVLLGPLNSLVNLFNVGGIAARQSANDWAEIAVCDSLYRLEVSGRGGRKPGLDDVDLKLGKSLRYSQFLPEGHAATRSLLAIAQGGVEDSDPVV